MVTREPHVHEPRGHRRRGAPAQVQVSSLAGYLEVMSKAVFQTGMSWEIVEKKWSGTLAAFHNFEPEIVANLPPWDVDKLAEDTRIIRNRRKIEAVIENATTMIELDIAHGGFRNYLRSHAGYDVLEKDLRKRFRFLGDMGIFTFLYIVGEQVPDWEEWCVSHGRGHMVPHDHDH